ncbi:TniB family NTP-binding protein [Variovorax sp. J31P207]|uniref:AAA family ATPase n=1 Tax=Variovorax sp. J31P207 TaxID=3053510 RepID=UPI002577C22A|nr:TniB family NTP-binding protein [Variovorax sp. J31P207]MDM0068785.1 AAA family ATPase [Variovorax sp. J31P207]
MNLTDLNSPAVAPLIASYTRRPGPEANTNALVLALPAVKSDEEWLEQLTVLPAFDESQLRDPGYLRSYYVAELKDFFIPAERARQLSRRLDMLIRAGYRKRNPLKGDHFRALQRNYAAAQKSGKKEPLAFSEVRTITSFSLIGVSGMGKSTTTEAVLAAYPQYILHDELDLHQVVWLKVECPRDGSVKELALNILRAFDDVLGTAHAPKSAKNVTLEVLMNQVKQLARAHCLGLLVLDELQNVSVRKSGGREELLNWYQELVNELKLPLLVLGTFKARAVLQLDARHSRRAGILGGATWRPLTRGAEFDLLVETLWSFQWLREPGELTVEFRDVIFEETQGVVAFIVDMFLVSQLQALSQGKETLTPELFRTIARTEFEILQPLLNALRSKQPNRIAKFEDVDSYDIDEIIQKQQLLIPKGEVSKPEAKPGTSLVARAAAHVRSAIGLSEADARRLVESVLTATHKTHVKLTEDALAAYFRAKDSKDETVADVA